MKRTNDKDFDCIKMKREIQARIYEETKDMSHAEFTKFLRKTIASSRFAELPPHDQINRTAG
jgi:hypothetical protein